MCGIAGIFNYSTKEPIKHGSIKKMCDLLSHRGPDAEGQYSDGNIALGHRRLSIIDLSSGGSQPMLDKKQRTVVSYNGEIYNYKALRNELEKKGFSFFGSSDTEVILYAYQHWGIDFLKKLNGIFALSLWDREEKTLILARDPIGVKPLFYSLSPKRFLFASEIKAILSDPSISREIDDKALNEYFHYNYSSCPNTGIKNIQQLEPGYFLTINSNSIQKKQFYSFTPNPLNSRDLSDEEYLKEFSELLINRVEAQTMADVPVGAFLSGGIDSSSIAHALKTIKSPVNLLHVSFQNSNYDESAITKEIARALSLPLTIIAADTDVVDLPMKISKHLEEPTADSSALAVYLLCQKASEQFKVALSGDGADELFAGYDTYQATLLAQKLKGPLARIALNTTNFLSNLIPVKDKKYSFQQILQRFSLYAGKKFPGDHSGWRTIIHNNLKEKLYTDSFFVFSQKHDPSLNYSSSLSDIDSSLSILEKSLYMDFKFYLPNDMLTKVDRMSMAHGLEVRVPFLDLEIVKFAHQLPSHLKLNGKSKKYILRKNLLRALPQHIINLPKSGFNFPIEGYLRKEWYPQFMDLLSTHEKVVSHYLKKEEVINLLNRHKNKTSDHRHELFGIFMFLLWIHNLENEWK